MVQHNKYMTDQEKVAITQSDIREIKQEMYELKDTVQDIHACLIGSPLGKDGGLVKRIEECEQRQTQFEQKIERMSVKAIKSEFYLKVIWALGGSIASIIFTSVMYYYFKK